MKSNSYRTTAKILTALILAVLTSGCSTIRHESATEWMKRQPWDTIP